MDVPAAHLLAANQVDRTNVITFSEAKDLYVKTKGAGRSKTFFSSAKRNTAYLIECLGDRSLDLYATTDAGAFRDWLFDKQLSVSSVRRVLTTIKAIFSLAVAELGLELSSPFTNVYIPTDGDAEIKRQPLSIDAVRSLQRHCMFIDDDLRWLLALISDTGMRLSEATGLLVSDLRLDEEVPHVVVQSHEWRSLKTSSSKRVIPLVGSSLWAAKRVVSNSTSQFCFTRYCSITGCNSNSASAALNKWLKQAVGSGATVHGLRHSLRDRLRNVDTPTEVVDNIGGWSVQTVGQSYGLGYSAERMQYWMQKMITD
tara:strand:- start:264 stop:1202 length:939 start_codon:yes stop_codon:yes gene_type:complete